MTSAERIALDEETKDLSIHVRMCALRHYAIMQAVEANRAELGEIKTYAKRGMQAVWALLILVAGGGIVSLPRLAAIAQAMAGH